MSNIRIADLKNKIEELNNNSISLYDFKTWVNANVNVEKYIPIVNKYAISKVFVDTFNSKYMNEVFYGAPEFGSEFLYMQYDIMKFFMVLLRYTNIDIEFEEIGSDNYDFIRNSYVYDYIEAICGKDYKELSDICDKVSGINNASIVNMLNEIFEKSFEIEKFLDATEKLGKILKSKKVSDNLKTLKDIELFNNPKLGELINGLEKTV